jgi:hypothetical protein
MGSNAKLPKITTAVFGSEAQGRDPLGVTLVPTDLTAVPAATPASLFISQRQSGLHYRSSRRRPAEKARHAANAVSSDDQMKAA